MSALTLQELHPCWSKVLCESCRTGFVIYKALPLFCVLPWQSCSLVSKGTSEQPCCPYWPSLGVVQGVDVQLITEVFVFCPVSQPGSEESRDSTIPRAELWAHQELLLLCLHRFGSKQSFSKFLLLLYPEHSVHPVQSSKSRHHKESFAATVHLGQQFYFMATGARQASLFCPFWFPILLAVPQHVCLCTGAELSSCWLQGWGRCPSEHTCSLQASLMSTALC